MQKMTRKPVVAFTNERKMNFIKIYRKIGLINRAAELVGINVSTVYDHRKFDPVFAEELEFAKQAWIEETLIETAIERATKGYKKPIVGGKDRDTIVTYETQYSDALHLALLKANRPEFREKGGAATDIDDGKKGGVLVVTANPLHTEHWETLYGDMADGSKLKEKKPNE